MDKPIAWMDINRKSYYMEQISDEYLLNIIKFVSKGGGYLNFLTEKKIRNLFREADIRGLKHECSLSKAILLFNHLTKRRSVS